MHTLPGKRLAVGLIAACLAAPAWAGDAESRNPDGWPSFTVGLYGVNRPAAENEYDADGSQVEFAFKLPVSRSATLWTRLTYEQSSGGAFEYSETRIGAGFTFYFRGGGTGQRRAPEPGIDRRRG